MADKKIEKKIKKVENGSIEGLGTVLGKLLDRNLSEEQKKRPILGSKRHIEAEINEAKLEQRLKKELFLEKKRKREEKHLLLSIETEDAVHEKALRKVATRGVVQLLNAIKETQKKQLKPVSKKPKVVRKPVAEPENNFAENGAADAAPKPSLKKPSLLAALPAYAGLVNVQIARKSIFPKAQEEATQSANSKWDVLKDDFLTSGCNMKDWDQTSASNSGSESN